MRDPERENKQAKGEVFALESPDGRIYRTSSPVEVNQLTRTRGYRRVSETAAKKAEKTAESGGSGGE